MAMFPTSAQQAWDQAVRVRAHSRRLRKQVAGVEERCAAIHDAMAAHAGPVVGAAERAARARRCRSGGTGDGAGLPPGCCTARGGLGDASPSRLV
jgi:hypothetical protein